MEGELTAHCRCFSWGVGDNSTIVVALDSVQLGSQQLDMIIAQQLSQYGVGLEMHSISNMLHNKQHTLRCSWSSPNETKSQHSRTYCQ